YALGLQIYRSQWLAGAAALLVAIPPVLLTLYTTASLGGYGELLLLGNLCLLLAVALLQEPRMLSTWRGRLGWLALGLLGGLGFWTFPLIGVYLLPIAVAAIVGLWRRWRALLSVTLLGALGFALGALPWLVYTLTRGDVTLRETGGQA